MVRLLGVILIVLVLYAALMATDENARSLGNHQTIAKRVGFYGVITLGVGLLIVSGGIDLSIGSVCGLSAIGFTLLLEGGWTPLSALAITLVGGAGIGWVHGLLVTGRYAEVGAIVAGLIAAGTGWARAWLPAILSAIAAGVFLVFVILRLTGRIRGSTTGGLQPFLVTLCGLFVYRGLARWATWWPNGGSSRNVGIAAATTPHLAEPGYAAQNDALRWLANGELWGVPTVFLLAVVIMLVLAALLHGTVWGRYWYAIGYNEDAARYAGISTGRYKALAYVICSLLAAFAGVLSMYDNGTAAPTTAGSLLELYAITGAVLGGCSLRGGSGMAVGMLLGAAVLPLLRQLTIFAKLPDDLEYAVIGSALLLGTLGDELLKGRR